MFTVKSLASSIKSAYVIHDLMGKNIHSGILTDEFTEINTSGWKPGIYFLKAENHKVVKIVCQ
jgi:hypothetical protein